MTTDAKENKTKKLTLNSSKLLLNNPVKLKNMARTMVSSTFNTIVEIKSSKTIGSSGLVLSKNSPATTPSATEITSEEFNKRLELLKKAAERAKEQDTNKINTITELAAINQLAENNAVINAGHEENTPSNVSLKTEELTSKNTILKSSSERLHVELEENNNEGAKKKSSKSTSHKPKIEEVKKLKKVDMLQLILDEDEIIEEEEAVTGRKSNIIKRRTKTKNKLPPPKQEKIYREVIIPEMIAVGELANRMSEKVTDVVKELMKLGVVASSSQTIDSDIAELVVASLGHTAKIEKESDVENILNYRVEDSATLQPRAPVVTVMGHVDHGKTSLLDSLLSTTVASGEAGGITQHLGAYKISLANGKEVTFIDTPGHEAFSGMRGRSAQITDIVVLVVAADDGVKPQTVEAINHAKAAHLPIIVAINKIDKPSANLEMVKNELLNYNLVAEEFGGDTMIVPISALKKINLDKLLEAIFLLAELHDLKSNPDGYAAGVIIESRIDKTKGVAATALVQRGTLKTGDMMVAGTSYGKIKNMNNDRLVAINSAGPSEPVEIYGLNEPPGAGDKFNVVPSEKHARDIIKYRTHLARTEKLSINKKSSLEDLFLIASGKATVKELPLIIKSDVQGSIEAITNSLIKLPDNEVKIKFIHSAVGTITESDVMLAKASNAIIIGFNVKANANALAIAEKEKVSLVYYSVIYTLIDYVKSVMSSMLTPIIREKFLGSVEIRQVFNISKIGNIGGSLVTKGTIKRGAKVKLLRNNNVIYEGNLRTLKRFKDDVTQVKEGFECGIALENYNDIQVGDIVEVFEIVEEKKQLL